MNNVPLLAVGCVVSVVVLGARASWLEGECTGPSDMKTAWWLNVFAVIARSWLFACAVLVVGRFLGWWP